MASGTLYVSPEELKSLGDKVIEDMGTYKRSYEKIYEASDSLKSQWEGEASKAFITQIEGFRNDFDSLARLFENYSEFLKVSANNYQNAENINIENAKELNNGN